MNVRCNNCGAELSVAEHLKTTDCPYCRSTSIVERPAEPDRPRPTFAIGFATTMVQAQEKAAEWLKGRTLFARSGLERAMLEDIRGVYVPAYLYSAAAHSDFRARIGEEYQERQTTTRTVNGKTVTETRTVTKTEWRPLEGKHSEYVAECLVTASKGLSNEELGAVEPFELGQLRRYAPALISGWSAEEATLAREEALKLAREEALAEIGRRLGTFMPGDKHDGLEFKTVLAEETQEPVLVPVWVMAARYAKDAPPIRVLVNGQTGKVWGKVPLSWIKIALAIALGITLAAAVVLLASQM